MIKVVGFWELSWNSPIKEKELWKFPLSEYEVDEHIMIPISGIPTGKYFREMQHLEQSFEENPDATFVFVDENTETTLTDFVHPENAVYVFGRTSLSPLIFKRDQDLTLKIESPKNSGGFWAHQVACVILHDRYMKLIKND